MYNEQTYLKLIQETESHFATLRTQNKSNFVTIQKIIPTVKTTSSKNELGLAIEVNGGLKRLIDSRNESLSMIELSNYLYNNNLKAKDFIYAEGLESNHYSYIYTLIEGSNNVLVTKFLGTKLDKTINLTVKEQNSPVVDVQFLSAMQVTVVLFQNGNVEFFRDYNYPAHNKLAELESSLTNVAKIYQIHQSQRYVLGAQTFNQGIIFLKKDGSSVNLISDPSTLTGKTKKIAKLMRLEDKNIIWSDTDMIVTKLKQQIYLYRLETSGYQQVSQLTDVKSYVLNPYLKSNNNLNRFIIASYDQTKDLIFAYMEYGELKNEFILFPKNISKNLTQNILLNHDNMILETKQRDRFIYYRGQDTTTEPIRKENIKEILQSSRSTLIQYQDHSFQIVSRNFESEVYRFNNPVVDVHVIPEVGFLLQLSNREFVLLKTIINNENPELRTFEQSLIQLPKALQTIHIANDNALIQFSDQKLYWLFKGDDLSIDFEPKNGNVTILDYLNSQIDFLVEVNSL